MQAVNNSAIATFGDCSLTLNLGLNRTFHWVFIVADVKHAILGTVLRHFNLLVHQCLLVDNTIQLQVYGISTQELYPNLAVCWPEVQDAYAALLEEVPSLTISNTRLPIPLHTTS